MTCSKHLHINVSTCWECNPPTVITDITPEEATAVVEKIAERLLEPTQRIVADLRAERDGLLAALKAVVNTDDDCPVCDRGRLRNPKKTHWPECPFGRAQVLIGTLESR